ncbi:TetR family transcriptional regulator C-terminal domain-containing protein [Streptomyces monomycini]|uniref:TetR family transcriptional regulator C-terminal domain-containing protein n=1 Tax=Streptomyces monomycini TaxID=371720 RepID=UPI001EE9F5A1|nr:TetR family transcriptional regulator C-terminal domain-containing protein [Streptomyces monomycini]
MAGERIEARTAAVDPGLPARAALRALVLTALPVDAERRAEAAAQLSSPSVPHTTHHSPKYAAGSTGRSGRPLAHWLASAGYGQGPDPAADCLAIADAVIALSDGLALRMLYTPHTHDVLVRALDRGLEALIPARTSEKPGAR